MNKSQKIKVGIFTGIILIASIILIFLAVNAYSYPDANQTGKVSITRDNVNKKIFINNPDNLSLSYFIQENTENISNSLIEQLKTDTSSIEQLTDEINTLNEEIDALQTEIDQLEPTLANLTNEKSQCESQKAEWQSQKASYTSQANSLRSQIEYYGQNVITPLENRVAQLQANASSSTESELYAATHELEEARNQLEQMRSQLAVAEDNANMLTSNIDTITEQISDLTTQIMTLNSQIAGKNATLTTKQNQVSEKEEQISTIQRQMPSLPSNPTSGYTNISRNEISYDALSDYSNKDIILWIKSTNGSDTYYDYFLVSMPTINQIQKYTVTFNPNGGTTQTNSKEVTQGEKYGTLPTASKDGSIFIGWFTERENGTQIQSYTVVNLTANQTLYAHYIENENNLEYNVTEITGNEKNQITNELFKEDNKVHIFDIDVEDGKNTAIVVPMPNGMSKNDNIKVYEIVNGKKTIVNYTIDSNNNIIFETNHDGRFVIVDEKKTTENDNNENNTTENINNDENNTNDENDVSVETVKYDIKELTGEEKENIKKEFSNTEDIYVFESTVNDSDKGKEITYKIDMPEGYSENDNIIVYAYANGEKIVVPHTIENGKIVFKTTLTDKFVIAKYKSNANTNTNIANNNINESIINPKTGDLNVKVIVILLALAIIVSFVSLIYIFKNNKKN